MKICNVRPVLNILIGPPGCGKSTYAHMFEDETTTVISSDETRKELYGDENCQKNPGAVFELMRTRAHQELLHGHNVIWDATNMTRKSRSSAISCKTPETKVVATIIWSPLAACIENDLHRNRTVGKDVIMRMLKCYQAPYYDEGIDEVIINSTGYTTDVMLGTDIPQDNPHHTFTIREHCHRAWEYAMQKDMSFEVQCAASVHDCGKLETKTFYNTKGEVSDVAHYYGHQGVSAWKAMGNILDPLVLWLISNHMEPYFNSKYYKSLSPWLKQLLDDLHECDEFAH